MDQRTVPSAVGSLNESGKYDSYYLLKKNPHPQQALLISAGFVKGNSPFMSDVTTLLPNSVSLVEITYIHHSDR